MDTVIKVAVMKFQCEFYMQILGIVMGTNLAPILANIHGNARRSIIYYMYTKNITWHKMFKIFIDDGFGIIKSNKKQFSRWVNEFNNLRENIFYR